MSKNDIVDPNLGLSQFEKLKHDQSIYLDAKINRHNSQGETQARANRALRDIATFIKEDSAENKILKGSTYLGSAAVHVYQSVILQTVFFVCQCDPMTTSVSEWTADKATMDLRRHMMASYNRTPTKKRSGF